MREIAETASVRVMGASIRVSSDAENSCLVRLSQPHDTTFFMTRVTTIAAALLLPLHQNDNDDKQH